MHYRALEFVNPVPFSRTNCKNTILAHYIFKPKSQKNVSANNCHPKVCYYIVSVQKLEQYTGGDKEKQQLLSDS